VAQGGGVLEYDFGVFDGKAMVFKTAPFTPPAGGQAVLRLTFTPLPDGTVRQHAERSTDAGTTWTTQYDFYYHRKAAP
jgi:hypothetical protein